MFGQINCPALLPEDPADARLTGLLAPAPHVVPEKKAKKKATGTRNSSRFQVLPDDESDTSRRRALFRVPVAFFLAFFSGTTWGAGASSPVRRASAGSSGNGPRQIVCSGLRQPVLSKVKGV